MTKQWQKTYGEFQRALFRSPDPFNPFVWIFRLLSAAGSDICEVAGLRWRPLIPIFALILIISVVASYFFKLRGELDERKVLRPNVWCHDSIVLYWLIMILFHFAQTSLSSPGIMLTEKGRSRIRRDSPKWLFWRQQRLPDAAKEQELLTLYGSLNVPSNDKETKDTGSMFFPDPKPSYCNKCDLLRPPRCHHCKVCNRCILQYDHHCVWVDNCIGYNNIRSFILLLFYVTAACWYGVMILYKPFYEPLKAKLREHGGLGSYVKQYWANGIDESSSVFAMPSIKEFGNVLFSTGSRLPMNAVVDVIFPLLFGVGLTLAIFLGTHIHYILSSVTTLERRIILDRQIKLLSSTGSSTIESRSCVNPFDRKSLVKNWTQIMGSSIVLLFLPIPSSPPPPPLLTKKQQ